jgi:hypothetical protein
MKQKTLKTSWTPEQNERLVKLSTEGVSAVRAGVILMRTTASVRSQSHKLGAQFLTAREIKKNLGPGAPDNPWRRH